MKCPKCKEEITDGVKFCTKCGANIEEENKKIAEAEAKKKAAEEKRKKAAEDKKRLEEIRKQEELKKEQALKEAEKQEAIRKAKEEGIELEIIDEEPKTQAEEIAQDFKVKKEEPLKTKSKKQKVKIKKNIFQRILNKLLFIIIVAALLIGAVYYCYKQNLLPEFAQNEIKDFDSKLQNVINLYKDVKEKDKKLSSDSKTEDLSSENWKVQPSIEADDIQDLTDKVSVIIKNKKEGLINNETGDIVLEAKYQQVLYTEYYDIDKTEAEKEKGIIVKDSDKFYKLDKEYKVQTEVIAIATSDEGTYFYEHHEPAIYYNSPEQTCTLVKPDSKTNGLKMCIDIDLVTTDGQAAKDVILPESFSIDFSKSKTTTKGYFNIATGELEINCDYDEAYEFSEGYAAVKKDNLAGIIDEQGENVIGFKYSETRSVHSNTAFVLKDGKWGILYIE